MGTHSTMRGSSTPEWFACLFHDIKKKKLLSPALRSQVQSLAARPQKWSPETRSSPELTDCPGSVQLGSVTQLCPALYSPMDCSTPGLPVHHQLPEFTQTHVHRVSDPIQPSHPLSSPSPPTLNLSQHQSLFHWVSSSHEVAKVRQIYLIYTKAAVVSYY